MSGSSSDWSKPGQDRSPIGSLAESMLATVSEIMQSVVCIESEKDDFIEVGCYFYRASVVIMEFHVNMNTPTNAIEILQSLSRSLDLAKSFTMELKRNVHSAPLPEVKTTMQQLESVVRNVGENLSMIPSSTYGKEQYAEKAARALSKEMRSVCLVVSQARGPDSKKQLHVVPLEDPTRGQGEETETDLYSIDAEVSANNLQLSDASSVSSSHVREATRSREQNDYENWSTSSLASLPQLAQYMEPLYETFFCPLTKKIMDDPVTIESGITYERKAITEWFAKFECSEEVTCPKSEKKLKSSTLSTNVALKATIEEWKERNETARIKVARAALSLASTEHMVLEAIGDLRSVCKRNPYNKVQIRSVGMIPLLANFLKHKSRSIRCATLELLQLLADDDEGKEIITKVVDIAIIIKMLSSDHLPVRHASVSLLLDLSRCQLLCDKIGSVTGGILMLVTAKYRQSSDALTSEKADEILKNLEKLPENIKLMAENGYWEPLLTHLVEGADEMRMEMASYLGEIVLGHERKTYVAEKASPTLIRMVQSGNSLSRSTAFKALMEISSHHPNAKMLVEAGILQIMAEEIFTQIVHNELLDSKTEAAAILANILESGIDLENFQVNAHGHTMASDYVAYNIVYRIKNSSPDELNINLIRILVCLMKSPKSSAAIVSVIKETDASHNLIELINSPNEEIGVAAIKLLITLSAFIGHTISDKLCKTRGLPENLIQDPSQITRITEKNAVSVNFLARLPHQNLTLNLALVNGNIVPRVLQNISQMKMAGTGSSRYTSTYFEGLVGIIVRLTATLYDHQILFLARTYNLASVLTDLLTESYSNEVQKLSAIGLENLSKQSIILSSPPQMKTKILKIIFFRKCISLNLPKGKEIAICPIHGGVCSSQDTFCLLDAGAVDRLLACLDREHVEVVEAALSALCTLLDEKVDVGKSVNLLSEKHAIQHVLNVIKEHDRESLRQKSFWMIEKFLLKGGDVSASYISQDRLFPATLVTAFHHGDDWTSQLAEKILKHLNKMPTDSFTFTM